MGITSSTEQKSNIQSSNANADQQQQRYIQQQLQQHQQKQLQQQQQQQQQLQQQQQQQQSYNQKINQTTVRPQQQQQPYKPLPIYLTPQQQQYYRQQQQQQQGSKSYGQSMGQSPRSIPSSGSNTGKTPSEFNVLMSPPSSPLVGPMANTAIIDPPIPTVFTWTGGGKEVYISGSFNNWKEKIPLSHSEKDFTLIYNLPPGVHQYKYIVDGKWIHSTEQPVAADIKGNLLNFVEVKSKDPSNDLNTLKLSTTPPGSYSKNIPEEEFQKIPPPSLPPHLRRALLNTQPSTEDPTLLPLPHHVMLNHLYSLPRKDKVTILGVTHRYKTKFVTTVLYKPVNESSLDNLDSS
ncbi:hypothetical protein CYY_000740 [Polysphondylium violaceum]|uniref:Association with the SNF1 complex (ASC) domain-containing protein n=1 Tax=Polysphondylium violaceum TaxID=133409 RepID=A0A8J4VB86_9MYCE|nr:hypothetical protein CYY_000740 [Polysphondylium violaceum]